VQTADDDPTGAARGVAAPVAFVATILIIGIVGLHVA
jgi:hypothetical protein